MAEYVKLFSTILDSSIMDEPVVTRWIWTVMLAMKDRDGIVAASVGGLARRAGVQREDIETALSAFLSPDPDSRTKDDEGRRIEVVDGGWRVLNHQKYRDLESLSDRRAKDAERQRRHRDRRGMSREPSRDVTDERDNHGIRSESDQRSGSVSSPPPLGSGDPAPARSTTDAKPWSAHDWWMAFGRAWREHYGTVAGPGGGDAAARATGALGDELGQMTAEGRAEAERRAPAMFREFLADASPALVKARHPWAWFVPRFGGLMVPAKQAAPPRVGGIEVGQTDQVIIPRVAGAQQL